MPADAGAPAGLLVELRQKTVQLLEAIDSGAPDEDAWQYTETTPHPNDPILRRADSDTAREIKAILASIGTVACNCRSQAEAAIDRVRADSARGEDHEAACPLHGDEAHPDWQDYVATNLLDALSQVPNSGDWWGALKFWAERHSSGRIKPNRGPSPVDDTARGEDHEVLAGSPGKENNTREDGNVAS